MTCEQADTRVGCRRVPWGRASMPARAQLAWLLTAQPYPRCPSHGGRCPSRPARARRQRLLSNAWVFFDRTKSVADCETRARWPGRAARATPERERAHRSFVYLALTPRVPRKLRLVSALWEREMMPGGGLTTYLAHRSRLARRSRAWPSEAARPARRRWR